MLKPGGIAGTGAAVAKRFSSLGYHLALLSRRAESSQPVQDEILKAGGHAATFPTDVSDIESVKRTFADISQKLPGAIEVAVFNASGSFVKKDFLELQPQDLDTALKVSSYASSGQISLNGLILTRQDGSFHLCAGSVTGNEPAPERYTDLHRGNRKPQRVRRLCSLRAC